MTRFQTTALPFAYRERGLEFSISECEFDGDSTIEVDSESRVFSIAGFEDWEKVVITGEITVPTEVVEAVFPEDEWEEPPGRLFVAVRSLDTIFRGRVEFTRELDAGRTYSKPIPLPRDTVRGEVELEPFLVRSRDGDETKTRFASKKGMRLASAEPVTVEVDTPDEVGDQLIDGEKAEFSKRDDLPSGDHLYYLDLRNAESPKLWLNSEHKRILEVLYTGGYVGARARMRDVILDEIQTSVWAQLLVKTATDIDEESLEPRHEWQETVIDIFGDRLCDSSNTEDVGRYLVQSIDSENLEYFMEDVADAVQGYIDPREQLINLAEEAQIL